MCFVSVNMIREALCCLPCDKGLARNREEVAYWFIHRVGTTYWLVWLTGFWVQPWNSENSKFGEVVR